MTFFGIGNKLIQVEDEQFVLTTVKDLGQYLMEEKSEKQFIYVNSNQYAKIQCEFVNNYLKIGGGLEDISYIDVRGMDVEGRNIPKEFPNEKIVITDAVTLAAYYGLDYGRETVICPDVKIIEEAEIFIEDIGDFYEELIECEHKMIGTRGRGVSEYLKSIYKHCCESVWMSTELVESIKYVSIGDDIIGHTKEIELYQQGWEIGNNYGIRSNSYDLKWNFLPEVNKEKLKRSNSTKEYIFDRVLGLCTEELESAYPGKSIEQIKEQIKKEIVLDEEEKRKNMDFLSLTSIFGGSYGPVDEVCYSIIKKCNVYALSDISKNDKTVCKGRLERIFRNRNGWKGESALRGKRRRDDLPKLEILVNEFINGCKNEEKEVSLDQCEYIIRTLQTYKYTSVITGMYQEYIFQRIFGENDKLQNIKMPKRETNGILKVSKTVSNYYARYHINMSLCALNIRSVGMVWDSLQEWILKYPVLSQNEGIKARAPWMLYYESEASYRDRFVKNTQLHILMKNEEIKKLFIGKGYARGLRRVKYILKEPVLEIYKQALADRVGKYVLTRLGQDISTPKNARRWMLSQYQMSDGSFVMFKNWKDGTKLRRIENLTLIYEQMVKCDVDKVYLYNIIGNGDEKVYENNNKEIVVIDGLIDVDGNIIYE